MSVRDLRFRVSEEGNLDKLVAHAAQVSRRIARTWIGAGRVSVNGKVWRIITKPVRAGADVHVQAAVEEAPAPTGQKHLEPRIVFSDRYVLVVDKPAGLLSEQDRFGGPSLETVLPGMLRARGERDDLWLVHRLDAGTSGVIALARTPTSVKLLNEAWKGRDVDKVYLAIVKGRLADTIVVNAPIERVQGTRHGVVAGGKPAETRVVPLVANDQATLVRAEPLTGRTHQIRVHLTHLGHPLYGDGLYGGPRYTPEPVPRPMLHAYALTLPHPKTGEAMRFTAKPPMDFVDLLARLKLALPGDLT